MTSPRALKEELRKRFLTTLFQCCNPEVLVSPVRELISAVFKFPDSLSVCLQLIQSPHNLQFLTEILTLFPPPPPDLAPSMITALISSVNANLPLSVLKIDSGNLPFLRAAARLAALFPSDFVNSVPQTNQNPHVSAWILLTISKCDPSAEFSSIAQANFAVVPKLAPTTLCFGILSVLSVYKEIEGGLSVRTIISFAKSLSDGNLAKLFIPIVLRICLIRLSAGIVKEINPLLLLCATQFRQDSENVALFTEFLRKLMALPEAVPVLRQLAEPLLSCLLSNIAMNMPFPEVIDNPSAFIAPEIGAVFVSLTETVGINVFDSFFAAKYSARPTDVLLMVLYMTDHLPVTFFRPEWIKPFVHDFDGSPASHLCVHACSFFAINLQSKPAIAALVDSLEKGCTAAPAILLDAHLLFSHVFPPLARQLNPGKSHPLVVDTLRRFLAVHFPEPGEGAFCGDFDSTSSGSTIEVPAFDVRIDAVCPEGDAQEAPTDETILFCKVISSLEAYPDLFPLLALSAGALHPQFAVDLCAQFPRPGSHRYQVHSLASYGTALGELEMRQLSALAHTFLMLLPGSAMALLGITLQRLPRPVVLKILQKTVPFLLNNTDEAARMVSLLAYAHPDLAIWFIDMVLAWAPVKKRFFFVLRFTETGEQVLALVFRTIHYCSIFIDKVYFVDDFLPYATQFLNKYLTHESRSAELYRAALDAIRGISNAVRECQKEHPDHMFPFKDFLVQYVCSYYLDVGETLVQDENAPIDMVKPILSALSALLPLRPIRVSDHHERAIELTAVALHFASGTHFELVLRSSANFFTTLLNCNHSLLSFIMITQKVFPALVMHEQWPQLCALMRTTASCWEILNLQLSSDVLSSAISSICSLLAYALPLTFHEDTAAQARDLIVCLTSLQCAIRSQILARPVTADPFTAETVDAIAVCTYVAHHYTSAQVFDVVTSLLSVFALERLLPLHALGILVSVRALLRERGQEEFAFDAQIIRDLLHSLTGRTPDVIDEAVAIFELLLSFRLFSVLSLFITQSADVPDGLFNRLITVITAAERGGVQLLSVIADALQNDDRQAPLAFAARAMPMLGNAAGDVANDIWARLFVGVWQNQELLGAIVGRPGISLEEFAAVVADERPLALPLVLNALPQTTAAFGVHLAIAIARRSPEMAAGFLAFAAVQLKSGKVAPDVWEGLADVFRALEFEKWAPAADSLTQLFLHTRRTDSAAVRCCAEFLRMAKDHAKDEFWRRMLRTAKPAFEEWAGVLAGLIASCEVSAAVFADTLPELVVKCDGEIIARFLEALGRRLGVAEGLTGPDLAFALLRAEVFAETKDTFLRAFVAMLEAGKAVPQATLMLEATVGPLSAETSRALVALAGQLPSRRGDDFIHGVGTLIRLLE
jgi:hypothetical protein